ncbi:hypothetical protein ACFYY8_11315 [Streptosporangium sp. NPDC001559]|uniref:hypothetical protein n=1 Tax=Streptosporangium sp. NPDC001559 TaxID=3366187 RepID=UPI0036EE7DDC
MMLGLCLTAVTTTTGAGSASADLLTGHTAPSAKPVPPAPTEPPDYLTPEDRALMERQQTLVRAGTKIRNLVEDGREAGYTGLEISGDRLVLWWKGTPPGRIERAVRQAGVPVDVRPATHSRAELRTASDRLWQSAGIEHGGRIHAVKALVDGSGLQALADPAQARSLTAIPDVGVPVAVEPREPIKATSTRCDDTVGWYGGGALRHDTFFGAACGGQERLRYTCTAGFGVRAGGTQFLLTAGHCGAPGDLFTDPGREEIGRATHENVGHDLLLIQTRVVGRIWDGTPGVNDFTKPVVGWGWSFPGQSLCYSGTTTGARCGYTVDSAFTRMCGKDIYGNSECWDDLISARKNGQGPREGDSGGPVFNLENGSSATRAIGTVTGYGYGGSNEWLIFQDFGTATRDWPGLDIVTY